MNCLTHSLLVVYGLSPLASDGLLYITHGNEIVEPSPNLYHKYFRFIRFKIELRHNMCLIPLVNSSIVSPDENVSELMYTESSCKGILIAYLPIFLLKHK